MIRRLRVALLVFAVLAVGAPGAHATPFDDAIGCDPIDPAVCLLPWPNNFFTTPAPAMRTRLRLNLNAAQMPRNVADVPIDPTDYNRNDGFSPGTPIVTKVPGLDTPEAFANTDPVTVLDLARYADAGAPIVVIDADTRARWPIWTELDRSEELDGTLPSPADTTLIIRPATNFAEGHRYIVALRNLRDANDTVLGAQSGFKAFRDGTAQGARRDHFDELFATLAEAGIAREDLYLAWDFTVASGTNLTERMLSIRDDAFTQLGDTTLADGVAQGTSPQFVIDNVTQTLPCSPSVDVDVPPVSCDAQGSLDARLYRHVEGRILVPCYLNQPGCPTGSRFLYATPDATTPTRIPGNMAAAPFQCNIPKDAATGTRFRPSLYGHGLFGSADEVNSGKLYNLAQYGLMFCATDWAGMATEDVPNGVSILADIGRFSTLADRMQQGMLNFLYLGRAMIHADGFCADAAFQANGSCVLDTTHLYYNGGSQGGIVGGALAAVAPDFTRAHLGVPGMNYSILLQRSSDFDTYAEVMYRTYPNRLERQLLFALIQTLWDRGESNGYAQHITRDALPNTPLHHVLMTPAFGDHQVTNWATEVMARTLGVSMRAPATDPDRHPAGANAYWGIPAIDAYPFDGNAMVIGEIGPLRTENGRTKGTTPPPVDNNANRAGVDPHGPDWSEQPQGYLAIGSFLQPDGSLPAVCGSAPCYLDGWTGP